MCGADLVADVAGADGVLGIFLQRVIKRDPEGAPAGQGEVVAVARVLLGKELAEEAGPGQQAVEVGSLPGVADDGVKSLVLEIEEEYVLVTGNARGGRGERRGLANRAGDGEPQVIGNRPVVAHVRRVRAVDVGQRCRQDQRDPGAGCPARQRAGGGPEHQPGAGGSRADRADGMPREHAARCGQERHRHCGPAPGRAAEPGGEPVVRAGGHGRPGRRPQRNHLPQPGGSAGAAGEHLPARPSRPFPGGHREMGGPVPDHGRQAAGYLPARDRDTVPAPRRGCAGLRARIDQQVGARRGRGVVRQLHSGHRPGRDTARPATASAALGSSGHHCRGAAHQCRERGSQATSVKPGHREYLPGACCR